MVIYPSRARLAASLTKLSTAGRTSSARQAAHRAVDGTPLLGTNTRPGRAWYISADAGHRLMPRPATTCRDEIPQVPQFNVHREHNPNCGASRGTGHTMATREA